MIKRNKYNFILALIILVSLAVLGSFTKRLLTKGCRTVEEILDNASYLEKISNCGDMYFSGEIVHKDRRDPGCFQFLKLSNDDSFVVDMLYKEENLYQIAFGSNYRNQIIIVNSTLVQSFLADSNKEIRRASQNVFYSCPISK